MLQLMKEVCYNRVLTIWFYLYKLKKWTKLIYNVRGQDSGFLLGEVRVIGLGFWWAGKVLFLNRCGSFMGLFVKIHWAVYVPCSFLYMHVIPKIFSLKNYAHAK